VGVLTFLLGQSCGDTLEKVSDLIGDLAPHECASIRQARPSRSGRAASPLLRGADWRGLRG
jgi:hypothetical protein